MRRRLGERNQYGPYIGRLGAACHADFHDARRIYQVSRFQREQPTEREPLPAGPESNYIIATGRKRWGSHDFPREALLGALAHTERLGLELQRVAAARDKLPLWGKRGEILYQLVLFACVLGDVRPTKRGWEHVGQGRAQAMALFNSRDSYERGLEEAWEVIAVLAVSKDILQQAVAAEAVDERVISWAIDKGFLT